MTEEEKDKKKKAFKIITTDITTEQIKKNISILLDESLEILNKEVVKLKQKIRLGDLSYEELDMIYQELEASAPKKEEWNGKRNEKRN